MEKDLMRFKQQHNYYKVLQENKKLKHQVVKLKNELRLLANYIS